MQRVVSVDFFRGLALTFVLLDHIDWWAHGTVFRPWTLMGLGFCDAAEAFVFLSGLTFGWVYTARMDQDGFARAQQKAAVRALQIYAAYAVSATFVIVLVASAVPQAGWLRSASGVGADPWTSTALLRALRMERHPFALGILPLYAVLLPFMPAVLAAARRAPLAVLAVSAAVYLSVQPWLTWSATWPSWWSGWFFHPAAWQLLFVSGLLCGTRAQRGAAVPRSRVADCVAAAIVLYALAAVKGGWLASGVAIPDFREWVPLPGDALLSKARLGPARLVHFLALAWLVTSVSPRLGCVWRSRFAQPVVMTGRHSLTLYCFGTLLAYGSAFAFTWVGRTPAAVLMIGLDACLLQFGLAAWLERRRTAPVTGRTGGAGADRG